MSIRKRKRSNGVFKAILRILFGRRRQENLARFYRICQTGYTHNETGDTMIKQPDLVYIDQGLFTAFIPETKEGEDVWQQLAEHTDGTGKVLTIQAKQIIASLRKAGYSVHKAKKSANKEIETMYQELEALEKEFEIQA